MHKGYGRAVSRIWAMRPHRGSRTVQRQAQRAPAEARMIDVYGMSSPNVVKITIMLEEVGLPYRQHHVNVFAGDQYQAEFLKISPNNKVPVIVDEDGPGARPLAVFESGAILMY